MSHIVIIIEGHLVIHTGIRNVALGVALGFASMLIRFKTISILWMTKRRLNKVNDVDSFFAAVAAAQKTYQVLYSFEETRT